MKWFKSSFWLAAVCICEGAFYDDLCDVYVIFTWKCMSPRTGPPSSIVLIFMKRLLSDCLPSLSLIYVYSFPLPCLILPATIQHVYLAACTQPCSWNICRFIIKDQLCHSNEGRSQMHKIEGGGYKEIMLCYQPEHLTSHCFPPTTTALQGC